MNKRTGMVDKSAGLNLGKTAPMATGNKGDAQAMETRLDARFSENGIDASVFVGGQFAGTIGTTSLKLFNHWLELHVNRYCKILPWIVLAALGISQPNSTACQVDVLHWNRALREPASGVESNFKASPHPFGLIDQFCPDFTNILVRQFRFDLLRGPRNAESGNGIRFSKLPTDRFIDKLREEFDLQESGVVNDLPAVDFGSQTPANIRPTMRVSNLAGINNALLVQEGFNSAPGYRVASFRVTCALPVRSDKTGHPRVECRGGCWSTNTLFVSSRFVGQSLSLSGVGSVVDSQAGGLPYPKTGVQIALTEIPERRASFLLEMRHEPRVGQGRTFEKEIKVAYERLAPRLQWMSAGWQILPLHYEARLFPVGNRPVGQESDISACFLGSENSRGRMQNQLSVPESRRAEPTAGGRSIVRELLALPTNLSGGWIKSLQGGSQPKNKAGLAAQNSFGGPA